MIHASKKGRTAIVGTLGHSTVYLFVTKDTCTYSELRNAIQGYFGIVDGSRYNESYQGLFLDGSYSSQMKAVNSSSQTVNINFSDSSGNYRSLAQIIALKQA